MLAGVRFNETWDSYDICFMNLFYFIQRSCIKLTNVDHKSDLQEKMGILSSLFLSFDNIIYQQWTHLLAFKNPVSGLLPASLYRARFNVEDAACGDSWIRDNVYSILAVWGMSRAFCKNSDMDEEKSKQYEMEQVIYYILSCMCASWFWTKFC